MATKKTNTGGKRVAKKTTTAKSAEAKTNTSNSTKKRSAAPVIAVCTVVFVAAVYAGLCLWAGSHVLPNSSVAGIELGGLTRDEAVERLEQAANEWQGKTVALTYNGNSIPCELDKANLSYDTDFVLGQLTIQDEPFLMRGANWIKALIDAEGRQAESMLVFEDQLYMDGLLTELNSTLSNPVEQHSIKIDANDITITMGHAGQAIDTVTVEESLLAKIAAEDYSDLALEAAITQPDPIDFEKLYSEVYIEPVNAALDGETFAITPHVTGVSFDLGVARNRYVAAKENETFTIPLVFTDPEITTTIMEESLFADKLGEAVSTVSGSSARKSNVKLASSMVTETIMLPGDEFSYWSKIAPCTKEQGFQDAPTYVNGLTVPGVGGGVCQVSSSIYTAALYSNLEIVQRNQHTYAVGYLPNGSDAMVNGGSSDFKFKNSTEWPIKIVAGVEGSKLTVQIWGTKTDDTYVKMEHNDLVVTPRGTVYKIDDTIPAGTTKTENGYTGFKNESYRCVYAGDGTLISRTLESKNNYKMRDTVIFINSADAYKYGVDPVTGEKLPENAVTPTPEPTPTPEVTLTPEPTPSDNSTIPDWLGGGSTETTPEASPEPSVDSTMPDWLRTNESAED